MKQRMRYILCVTIFIILFICLFQRVSHILYHKVKVNDTVASFYNEKKDSMDVLFVGSSHCYRTFSPMYLWNETGITSYVLGTASQSIPCSYYLIKEGIRLQHPQIIVLETYTIKAAGDYLSNARLHEAIDNIPLNATKMEILTDFLPDTLDFHERLEFVFPIIRYHTRWSSLSPSDFRPEKVWLRGYEFQIKNDKIKEMEEPEYVTEEGTVYARNMEYIEKIIKLCEENDIQLVLVQAPMAKHKHYKTRCSKMNTLKSYAEEMNIPYISFEDLREEIGLDYSMDFKDNTHLNIFGAEKATHYIGNWMMQHYNLPDHRGEQEFETWNSDYQSYEKEIKKHKEKILENIDKTTK